MISLLRESRRRAIIPLLGLGLAAYYVLVFEPLQKEAAALDTPLRQAWKGLVSTLEQTNAASVDFAAITNQLRETRQAVAQLDAASKKAAPRLDLGPDLRQKMKASFQLVEYENDREKEIEELTSLAAQQQVTLDPAVFSGFPEHTADTRQPDLLWPALVLIDGLLSSAIECKVGAIHSLDAPIALCDAPATNPVAGQIVEIPLQIELTAPAENAGRWIRSLPLRAEELRAAGLPEVPRGKPPLLIDRLVIRKQSPEKPDEVRVWLRVVGYVMREGP
jgi:hypothetical protein